MRYRLIIFFLPFVALTSCNRLGHGGKSQPASATEPTVSRNDAITVAQAKEEYAYMQGCIEYSIGNYEESRVAFLDVIKLDDKSAATYYMLADIYRRQGDLATAITYAESAVKFGLENEWYHIRLGELYLQRGRNDEAIAQYTAACAIDPGNTDMLLKLGEAQMKVGKYADALVTYNKVESKEGLSDTLCNARIKVFEATHDTIAEEKELLSLVNAFPYELDNVVRVSDFYTAHHMPYKAKDWLESQSKLHPESVLLKLKYADVLFTVDPQKSFFVLHDAFRMPGETKEKAAILDDWYGLSDPDRPLIHWKANEVDSLCSMLREADPENAYAWKVSGDFYQKTGALKDARKMYAKAVELDGNLYDTWINLLKINDAANDDVQQEKDCKFFIDLYPAQPEGYYYLGMLQSKKNDFAHAVTNLQAAKDFSESKPAISRQVNVPLADAYRGKGDDAKADAFSESVIATDSTTTELMLNYSASLVKRQLKLDDAQKLLMKCLSINANDAAALELMGDVSSRKGNRNDAEMYWKKAKAAGSHSSTLDKKIATGSLE